MTTAFDDLLSVITDKALNRDCLGRVELLAVLASRDDELLDVIAAASRVRRKFFGRRVKLNYLVNMKSGMCPGDAFAPVSRKAPTHNSWKISSG